MPNRATKGILAQRLQDTHACAPGGQIDGMGIAPAVMSIVQKGPGLITCIGFILIDAPIARNVPDKKEAEKKANRKD